MSQGQGSGQLTRSMTTKMTNPVRPGTGNGEGWRDGRQSMSSPQLSHLMASCIETKAQD